MSWNNLKDNIFIIYCPFIFNIPYYYVVFMINHIICLFIQIIIIANVEEF